MRWREAPGAKRRNAFPHKNDVVQKPGDWQKQTPVKNRISLPGA
jgi:hypothetical protein